MDRQLFLICYPDKFDTCFYFKQSNNPFDGSARAGFELPHDPSPVGSNPGIAGHGFVGLVADSTGYTMSDGNLGNPWFFAIGTMQGKWTGEQDFIPGPAIDLMSPTNKIKAAAISQLYAFKEVE